jgi:hypothetical protein
MAAVCTPVPVATNGPPYRLTISPAPVGGRIAGAGISCGTNGAACSVTMPAPMQIGIEAVPNSGYVFQQWTGHCAGSTASGIYVALNGPRTCSAVFAAR